MDKRLKKLKASLKGLLSVKYFIDLVLIITSYWLSYLVRFEGIVPVEEVLIFKESLLTFVLGFLICDLLFGLTRSIWRYTSLQDIENIGFFVLSGSGLSVLIGLIFFPKEIANVPRSIYIINFFFLFFGISGTRLSYRILFDQWRKIKKGKENVLIVGDQNIGVSLQQSILQDRTHQFNIVGFITLVKSRIGNTVNATPIIGLPEDIPSIAKNEDIKCIFIALDSASNEEMKKVIKISQNTGVLTRISPSIVDLINSKFSLNDLREVKFEDYLDRQPVKFDLDKLKGEFFGKNILVTGAGGSIGASLCEELLVFEPARLIAIDLSENNLFGVSQRLTEIKKKMPANSTEIIYKILDIKDQVLLGKFLEANSVDYLIHTAALKHVPFCEENPQMAIQTNLYGTLNLLLLADRVKIKKFIYISTDKAVNPISIMGVTKRIGELLVKDFSHNKSSQTKFMAVRFGNVIGSSGNVVEIFTHQLQKGLPLTITDSRMERYFMSLEEATKLIMEAIVIGGEGETFVLDMGRAVKIRDLADDIALFYGRQIKEKDIIYIGKRKAEKITEDLFGLNEEKMPTSLGRIFEVREKVPTEGLIDKVKKLCQDLNQLNEREIREELFAIIE
ncbi:MAG: polysaccharide biosynthesis protein [Candidatus Omnitrophica bacterium]|jgi:FlaA1/EpsC-like NDP-sugar epimerase|nr:polysaccharide biosynthesis protein [Candidatus Omnitrophota bacterium]